MQGQRIPKDVVFRTRVRDERIAGDNPFRWQDLPAPEIFAGRRVVVFSLPGAFTPTCSSTHLPRYNELAPVFAQNGIDEIVCVSVNDPFVMEEWGKDQEAASVFLLADGYMVFAVWIVIWLWHRSRQALSAAIEAQA